MDSLTTWTRLEPLLRNEELTDTLEARVHDPLWLLGRQWQLGEFRGEDAGSPVSAAFDVTTDRVTGYALGDATGQSPAAAGGYGDDSPPLEALVERERVRPDGSDGRNLRLAAEAGDYFLRLLASHGLSRATGDGDVAYAAADFADVALDGFDADDLLLDAPDADLDPESRRYAMVVDGRSLDGDALYDVLSTALADDATLPTPDGMAVDSAAYDDYETAAEAYCDWYADLYDEPDAAGSAWDAERMEYEFAVAAGPDDDQSVLGAEEYDGGHLDWYSFTGRDGDLAAASADAGTRETTGRSLVPTPVQWPGMPAPRWWELEDANVDLNDVDAAPEDLSRLLLLEFALVYGNDWFELPVDAPVGSLVSVDGLTITDTFGRQTEVKPTTEEVPASDDSRRWRLYDVELADGDAALFLPPTLGDSLESDPVEDVLFVRDEGANVAWAIEYAVEGPLGLPLDRHERAQEEADGEEPVTVPAGSDAEVSYRLATDVPEYWIPLLPEDAGDGESMRLRLGDLVAIGGEDAGEHEGRLLDALDGHAVPEEEIPRAGTRVERAYQLARWIDGGTHLWSGRTRRTGSGEGASALRFDFLADAEGTDDTSDSDGTTTEDSTTTDSDGTTTTTTDSGDTTESQSLALVAANPDPDDATPEHVVFENRGNAALDLTGWTVADEAGHSYQFPDGFALAAGDRVTLYTSEGSDTATELYWGRSSPVWNNTGDTVVVTDADGDTVVSHTY